MDSVSSEKTKTNNDLNNVFSSLNVSNSTRPKVDYIDYSLFVGKSEFNYKSGYSEYGYTDAELRQACKFEFIHKIFQLYHHHFISNTRQKQNVLNIEDFYF
jgi:hypothetical protein